MRILRLLVTVSTVFLIVLGILCVLPTSRASAQSLTISASADWLDDPQQPCTGSINGQQNSYYDGVVGDSVTFNVSNASTQYILDIEVSEPGQVTYTATINPGESKSTTFPVTSDVRLAVDSNSCQSGHGGPGTLDVEGAAGTISCSIQNNQVWTVSLNYSNIFASASLYRDGTYVYRFPSGGSSIINTPVQFSAQATPATYYFYYSSDNSGRLLGQTTCPAKTAVAAPVTTTTPTPTPPTAPAPATAPTTTSTPTTANKAASPKQTSIILSTQSKTSATKPVAYAAAIGTPVVLIAFAAVWFLNLFAIRPKIRRLLHQGSRK